MKRCDHNHEFEAASVPGPEGQPVAQTVTRRIEMTVEREVISVVRRGTGTTPGHDGTVGSAVCEFCGQALPSTTLALPAETGEYIDSKADDVKG
jgi:hypothetical protein